MKTSQVVTNGSHKGGFSLIPQPQHAWIAILGLILFSTLCILGGGTSKILNIAFPTGSLAIGIFLYRRYPILYISFTWWMFFLTPFVRRLVDWKSGFTDPSPILLSPLLVAMVTIITFYRHLPNSHQQGGLPFVLSAMSVFYGFLIALINSSPVSAVVLLLGWLSPILFGYHLFMNWQNYPSYCQNIQCTFLWAVLVTGAYGVYQYIFAPEWDCFWLISTKLETSMGHPAPFEIRVWSTMNSPLHFSTVMIPGLILLFLRKGVLILPASGFGYLAILLTAVRTAWIGWFLAFITLTASLKTQLQIRLIVTVLVMTACVTPLTNIEPFAGVIQTRLSTFSNIENDSSFQDRSVLYQLQVDQALDEILGKGLGGAGLIDSGILDMLFSMGWIGVIPYIGGISMIFLLLFQSPVVRSDPFASAARSISLGFLPMLAGANVVIVVSGMVFWGFLAISMAGHKYHLYQSSAKILQ